MTLDQLEAAIMSDVANRFVDRKVATSRRELVIKFRKHPVSQAIGNLLNQNIFQRQGSNTGEEEYLPTAAAFQFSGDLPLREKAKLAATVVLRALQEMSVGEPRKEGFVLEDLKQHIDGDVDDKTLRLGLYLAKDLNVFQGMRLNPPHNTEVVSFQVGEGAITMQDPETEWDTVMARYKIRPATTLNSEIDEIEEAFRLQGGADWERIRALGGGGQSDVFLVRSPARVIERAVRLKTIQTALDGDKRAELADAIWSYSRPESPSELGAQKVFKIPPEGVLPAPPAGSDGHEAIERFKNEIYVLSQGRPGLPRLLHSSLKDRWLVTEYFPERTLEQHPLRYRGKPTLALRGFRSLVETVASLHKDNYIHRDIKPPNVFIRNSDELVLGDFGIVYVPATAIRLTLEGERVGPRDYMPPWAHRGKRVDNVEPNWDVYMLGKLLWSMLDGRLFLPREDYKDRDFDLTQSFPNDPNMQIINEILAKCVVKDPENCLKSAQELLGVVEGSLDIIERGMPMLNREGKLALPCRVCGKGFYSEHNPGHTQVPGLDSMNVHIGGIRLRVFICNVCLHYEFFAPGFPDEAPKRGWTP